VTRVCQKSETAAVTEAWRKLGEAPAFEGRYRRVVAKTFELPSGEQLLFEVKAEEPIVATLALTPEVEVVLVREFRVGTEEFLLELPGGIVDTGEDPATAAARELVEETGYAGVTRVVGSAVDCAYSTRIKHACVATHCRRVRDPERTATEDGEVVLLSLDDFRAHLRSGRLTDVDVGYLGLDALGLL
jgi:ADP-ribose pyrophosphatase